MDPNQAREILQRYQNGKCTPQEEELVNQWWRQLIETSEWQWSEGEKEQLQQVMEARLLHQINIKSDPQVHRVHFLRTSRRWAAAAAVLILISAGSYFAFFNKHVKQTDFVKKEPVKDVEAPKGTKAMITLADGKQISIDSLTTINQGNVSLIKTKDGKIIYSGSNTQIIYNTLTNPRGSKVVDMTLADGSRVWLNAGSSVTYPVAFVAAERKVTITGEAYFEVMHNSTIPFTVSKGNMEVRVLGTHFNVNAYDDESDIKVTLLQGSVEVTKDKASGLLKPGQQAQVTNEVKVVNGIDLEQVMAWKNGFFSFNRADIKTIMRQLARWYDLEVQYEGQIPQREFSGEMQRDLPLSGMMRLLEKGKVHLRLEGKKLVVLP